jgi:hypothetical protein
MIHDHYKTDRTMTAVVNVSWMMTKVRWHRSTRCKQQTVHETMLPMEMMLLVFILIHCVLEAVDDDEEGRPTVACRSRGIRKRFVDVITSHHSFFLFPPIPISLVPFHFLR